MTLFLVQNGVFAARRCGASQRLIDLANVVHTYRSSLVRVGAMLFCGLNSLSRRTYLLACEQAREAAAFDQLKNSVDPTQTPDA